MQVFPTLGMGWDHPKDLTIPQMQLGSNWYGNTWDFLEPKQISLFCKKWDRRRERGSGTEVSAFQNHGRQST